MNYQHNVGGNCMAIKKETLENGLIRHYSDGGKMLKQVETGILYDEAVDLATSEYTYTECEEYNTIMAEQTEESEV